MFEPVKDEEGAKAQKSAPPCLLVSLPHWMNEVFLSENEMGEKDGERREEGAEEDDVREEKDVDEIETEAPSVF